MEKFKIVLIVIVTLRVGNSLLTFFLTNELGQATRKIKQAQSNMNEARAHLDSVQATIKSLKSEVLVFRILLDFTRKTVDKINGQVQEKDAYLDNVLSQLNVHLGKLKNQQTDVDKISQKLPNSIPVKPLN